MGEKSEKRLSMASPNGLECRPSSPSTSASVFGDDNAFDAMGVADGFRPAVAPTFPRSSSLMPSASSSSSSSQPSSSTSRLPSHPSTQRPALTPSLPSSDEKKKPDTQARRSIMKGPLQALGQRNSFSLRYDASEGPQRRPSAATSEMTQRPMSTLSGLTIPRTQSPFVGASGPSHPYGMYPQDTSQNRTSIASTIRPSEDRAYSGPSRPTHPYGMYPQTTLPEPETNALAGSVDIVSAGFPGLSQPYARRLGPNGEGADDIIGADGYTEQLPPYSRYADAIPPKARSVPDEPRPASPPSPPMLESHESPDDGLLARAAPAEGAEAGEADESASPTPAPNGARERMKAKWARSKRRTCFGKLPMWVIYLGVFLLIVLAATVGGAVGRYFGRRAAANTNSANYPTPMAMPTATTLIDAEPLTSTPSNLPPLPTGYFNLGLTPPTESSAKCLTNPTQGQAWMCNPGSFLTFNVTPSDGDATQIQFGPTFKQDGTPPYGPTTPHLDQSVGVTLMEDRDHPEFGPAYFFQAQYTKMVVLPSYLFNGSVPPGSKRSLEDSLLESELDRRSLEGRDFPHPKPGEEPWYCYWNGTVMEGFIYVTEDSSGATLASTPTALLATNTISNSQLPTAPSSPPAAAAALSDTTTSSPYASTSSTGIASAASASPPQSGPSSTQPATSTAPLPQSPPAATQGAELAGVGKGVKGPAAPVVPVAPVAAAAPGAPGAPAAPAGPPGPPSPPRVRARNPERRHHAHHDFDDSLEGDANAAVNGQPSASAGGAQASGGGGGRGGGHDGPSSFKAFEQKFSSSLYPKVVKLAERRTPKNIVAPYCQQMLVNPDKSVVPALDKAGNTIVSVLVELEPVAQERVAHYGAAKGTVFYAREGEREKKRQDSGNSDACLCEWLVT